MVSQSKIAIYSRKSKFTGRGESIENQIELCRRYIRVHYPEDVDDDIIVYEDEGYSGGNTNRPRFREMMSAGEERRIKLIICYRLDRISRDIGDFARLIDRLNDLGIGFVSVKEQFDTASPLGRAMMYIASVFSQLGRETIAERIRDNMLELSKSGRWLGGATPTGYISHGSEKKSPGGKTKRVCHLVLIPREAQTVRLVFEKFLETNSLSATEAYLDENCVRTKNDRRFSRYTIRAMLKNPVYSWADKAAYEYFTELGADLYGAEKDFDGTRGLMAYNKTFQRPGRTNRTKDISKWIVAPGRHPGIVTGRDWVAAQEIFLRNNSRAPGAREYSK